MVQNDIVYTNNRLKAVVGAEGLVFGRVAAMPWIIFVVGDLEYALHLQCCFRILSSDCSL